MRWGLLIGRLIERSKSRKPHIAQYYSISLDKTGPSAQDASGQARRHVRDRISCRHATPTVRSETERRRDVGGVVIMVDYAPRSGTRDGAEPYISRIPPWCLAVDRAEYLL